MPQINDRKCKKVGPIPLKIEPILTILDKNSYIRRFYSTIFHNSDVRSKKMLRQFFLRRWAQIRSNKLLIINVKKFSRKWVSANKFSLESSLNRSNMCRTKFRTLYCNVIVKNASKPHSKNRRKRKLTTSKYLLLHFANGNVHSRCWNLL